MSPLILHGGFGSGSGDGCHAHAPEWRIDDVLARWREVQQKFSAVDNHSIPGDDALRILVNVDLPRIIDELRRLQQRG